MNIKERPERHKMPEIQYSRCGQSSGERKLDLCFQSYWMEQREAK